MKIIKVLSFLSLISLSFIAVAALPSWQIVPAKSNLKFTATQNGAPVSGEFKKFSGDIVFDPKQLAASHIDITVDMASVSDSYNQLQATLASKDWFDVSVFPKAIFKSTSISAVGDKKYQAKGNLTIRDKTVPVVLNFTEQEYSATHAVMVGEASINRTDFGVGQGEWSNTDAVKDEVKITFTVDALTK